MEKRIKKPTIKPEKRLEWLHRVEKEGETLTHIMESDNVDIRTVRKHLEIARLERDVQQARKDVLRDALTEHYRDLLETVRNIQNQISSGQAVSIGKEPSLMSGLRSHMPRSPLWANLRRWNQTLNELAELEKAITDKLQKEITDDGRLDGISSEGAGGATQAAVDVLIHQIKQWARGTEGLQRERDIHLEKGSKGRVEMSYGFSHFGEIDESSVDTIKDVLSNFERELRDWPELREMEKLQGRLLRLRNGINEILTVVLLRRLVPGKCKFCPI